MYAPSLFPGFRGFFDLIIVLEEVEELLLGKAYRLDDLAQG